MSDAIKYFPPILIIISDLLLLGILSAIIDTKCYEERKFKYVYDLSKILTVKAIVLESHYSEILDSFSPSGEAYGLPTTYINYLKLVKNNECVEYYKKCGILDTIGNPLCIDEMLPCPINKMKVDNIAKQSYYLSSSYQTAPLSDMSHNYGFFYSNIYNEGKGKVIMIKTKEEPKYITYNNFVVDTEAYKEKFGDLDDIKFLDEVFNIFDDNNNDKNNDNNNNDSLDKVIKIIQILKDSEEETKTELLFKGAKVFTSFLSYSYNKQVERFEKYIKEKIEKNEKNIDKYYIHIGDNIYTKNYIGFKNSEDIDKFMNFDYKNIYEKIFPNFLSSYFAIACIVFLCIIILIFFILLVKIKNSIGYGKYLVIAIFDTFVFLPIALGYLIYSVIIYVKVTKNKDLDELKSISSDEFINDFINEFVSLCQKSGLILSCICITSISIGLHLISFLCYCCIGSKTYENVYIY